MSIIYGYVTLTKSFSVAQIILGDYKYQNCEKNLFKQVVEGS